MNVENVWKSEEKILNATGMTKAEAEDLIPDFTIELNKSSKGRPTKLDDRGVFLLMMLYYRHYPTYELLGLMFEIDPSNASRWVDRAETAFRKVLSKKNFSHLILQDRGKKSREPLSNSAKSILMALNKLSADQKIKMNNGTTIQERKNDTHQKSL